MRICTLIAFSWYQSRTDRLQVRTKACDNEKNHFLFIL